MESMKISQMDNVEKIWLDELTSNAFGKLQTIIVEYCDKLACIFASNNILGSFRNLEKLTVTSCSSLEVVFQVQEFNFSEGHSASTFQLRELVLTRLPKMKHLWSGLPQGALTFGCLRRFSASECESVKSLFPSSVAKSMTQLEILEVSYCGVEEIIAEEDGEVGTSANDPFFPGLTALTLLELPELRSFHRNSRTSTWPLLKQLTVASCSKIRTFSSTCESQSSQGTNTSESQPALFSVEKVIPQLEQLTLTPKDVAMMQHYIFGNLRRLELVYFDDENVASLSNLLLQRFPNLETLDVSCCSFEEIFPEDAFGHGGATPFGELTGMEKPLQTLGKLKLLTLVNLHNLRRVLKDGSSIAEILKQIETLFVWGCPGLSIIFPSPTSFQRLTQLEVKCCTGLVHMATCSAVTSLTQLTVLILSDCGAMEDVVTDDGNGVEEITFPKLHQLTLEGLPSLESFSPTKCAFRFPSLMIIFVNLCPKMNIFCNGALKTPQLHKVQLSLQDDEGRWEGDLNTTIQKLSP